MTLRNDGEVPDVRTLTPSAAALLDDAIEVEDWSYIPPEFDRITYEAPSGEIAGVGVGRIGDPRMILVPGVTGSKEDFTLMLPLLAHAGYRVESFDLAGQNHSAAAGPERLAPPRRDYDYDLFVGDLEAIVATGTTPVHFLGYSFGGSVVQLFAARHPELVSSITLLSAPPTPGQAFRTTKSFMGPLSRVTNRRVGAGLMMWGLKYNFTHVPESRHRYVMERLPVTRRKAVTDIIGLMRRTPDLRATIAALDIPKLVAYGAHDLWPGEVHQAYARAIGAEAVEYRAGHSPCEETPHQLTRDMVRIITQAA